MRFLIVYTLAWVGALAGAAVGPAVPRPTTTPGPDECGMWALPGIFLGGAVGAVVAILIGLRLTRRGPGSGTSGERDGNSGPDRP